MNTCRCSSCENIVFAAGLCSKHYSAWQRRLHPLTTVRAAMMSRCYNPNTPNYAHYGGKGIRVCDRWRLGEDGKTAYECFANDMGIRPNSSYSIDRINVNGDYTPENCRWATKRQQSVNQGISKRNTSGVKGVYYRKKSRVWEVGMSVNNTYVYLGRYRSLDEAKTARAAAEKKYENII